MNVTIVTMIYRLTNRTKEDILKYLEYGKEFILKLNYNLIIYTDDTEIIEFIKLNRTYKCMIYIIPLNKTYYYKDINNNLNSADTLKYDFNSLYNEQSLRNSEMFLGIVFLGLVIFGISRQ